MSRFLHRLDLYRVTISHLHPSQVYHRARRLAKNRLQKLLRHPLPPPRSLASPVPRPFAMAATCAPSEAEAVARGRFAFLNLPEVAMAEVDWTFAPEGRLLWLFYLHYFGYAVELAQAYQATGDGRYAATACRLMVDWITHNPMPQGQGWHPYPTSKRLHAWALSLAVFQEAPEFKAGLPSILASIEQQARYLLDSREYDVLGNHLLANLHSLAWLGMLLGASLPTDLNQDLAERLDEFWSQFLMQTRDDGSHEENTLSYQMIVAQDAFETMVAAENLGKNVPEAVKPRVEAMFDHLLGMLKPDGALPMVNDTLQGYPMAPGHLLAAGCTYFERPEWKGVLLSLAPFGKALSAAPLTPADADPLPGGEGTSMRSAFIEPSNSHKSLLPAGEGARRADEGTLTYTRWLLGEAGVAAFERLAAERPQATSLAFRDAGYYVIRSGYEPLSDYMLFDCGPLGPRHLMAHAHADTLSVELSALGASIVLDPGVFEYRAGKWRDHFRSTAAHNTVRVDEEDQSEMWASFRVARRADATLEDWVEGRLVAGSHDGYHRLNGTVTHRRSVEYHGESRWSVFDQLASQSGEHHYELTWQLAPGVKVLEMPPSALASKGLGERMEIFFHHPQGVFSRFAFEAPAGVSVVIERGWVSYRWNEKKAAPVLKLRLKSSARSLILKTEISVHPDEAPVDRER